MLKQNNSTKFDTESIKSSLLHHFDAFILVTEDITVSEFNNTPVAFTTCAPLSTCKTEINDLFNQNISTKFKQNNSTAFPTESIKSSLSDYFHAFILVTRDITLTVEINTHVSFAICAPVSTFNMKTNNLFKRKDSAKFQTERIKSSLWDYFYAFNLVTGDITLTGDNNNTDVAFTNCSPFSTWKTETNDLFKQNNSAKI